MLIAYILLFIILFMIYIYTGLQLVEPIKNENIYIFFWVAYIFFGITLSNIFIISKYWGKISTKIGPPGPRGPRGSDGDTGPSGVCTSDTNLIYAQKEIKDTIANTIKENYNDLALDDIYDDKTLKLTNNYLNYRIKLMITSKQFETVLNTPTDNSDNTPNETKVYGKTIEDLSSYLSSIWREWINGIINIDKDNARHLFITFDAQIDISPKIEEYFNNEIMKYDIWYWGATRLFRPLEAEICRSNYKTTDGKTVSNSRYPMNNRPILEIMELEFTDMSIKDDKRFIKIMDLNLDTTDNMDKYKDDFTKKYDVVSSLNKPVFYLPNVYTNGDTLQKYYPLGCIIVDDNSNSTIKKKTIIVSGDVVFPTSYNIIWDNSITIQDNFNSKYRYRRKRGARRTENKRGSNSSADKYNLFLSNNLINKNNEYSLINDLTTNKRLDENTNDEITFLEFKTNIPEYQIIGDLPNYKNIIQIMNYDNKDDYKGIVAIPVKALEKLKDYNVSWSFRHDKLLNKSFEDSSVYNVPDPPNDSRFNKNYSVNYKKLNRKVITSKSIDIFNDKEFNILKFRYKEEKPSLYKIKDKILNPTIYSIKTFDKKYEDLGFGWFGYPLKKYRKYSIFAYLGLMPEGIIVHRPSGRKFYIKHYGGVEPNKFIVYLWDENKKDFKNAITCKNSNECIIGVAKKTDPRCQFKVILYKTNSNYFTLEPIEYPKKYLNLSFKVNKNANLHITNDVNDESLKDKRPKGINLDHTKMYISLSSSVGNITLNNPVIFFNQTSTGTNMQIVNEKMPRNINRANSTQEQYKQQLILDRTDKNSFNYLYKDTIPNELLGESFPDSNLSYT